MQRPERRVEFNGIEHLEILERRKHFAFQHRPKIDSLLAAIVKAERQGVRRDDFKSLDAMDCVTHYTGSHLAQRLDLERRVAGLQELPVPRKLVAMDFCPGFDDPLLGSRKTSSDALDRIKSENGGLVLIRRMKMRPVMRRGDVKENLK